MDRYYENLSPQPNVYPSEPCIYKSPIIQPYNIPYFQSYLTPPSDNEGDKFVFQNSLNKLHDLTQPTAIKEVSPSYSLNSSEDINSSVNTSLENQTSTRPLVQTKSKRRSRTTFSKKQLDTLETTFQKCHYPEVRVVDDLSISLNLSIDKISIWFQNRRARLKKATKSVTATSLNQNSNISYPAYSPEMQYNNAPNIPMQVYQQQYQTPTTPMYYNNYNYS